MAPTSNTSPRPFLPKMTDEDWKSLNLYEYFDLYIVTVTKITVPGAFAAGALDSLVVYWRCGMKATPRNFAQQALRGGTWLSGVMSGGYLGIAAFCSLDLPHPFHVPCYLSTVYWGAFSGASWGLYSIAGQGYCDKQATYLTPLQPRTFARAGLRGGLVGGAMASVVVLGIHTIYGPYYRSVYEPLDRDKLLQETAEKRDNDT